MKLCSRCVTPETHETIVFDEQGVCNVCNQIQFKKERVDWAAKKAEFAQLLEAYRGQGDYDCIVPFSGGKDSTWTLYSLVRDWGVKPLVVCFDHTFMRPGIKKNVEKVLNVLGCDYLHFRPSWHVVRALMLETLFRKGDFCWHCHTGIFAYPMQIAVKHKIPLVIWGEPSAEYTSYYGYDEDEEVDERRFNRFVNLGIAAEDMAGMIPGITLRDLAPFRYPSRAELRAIKCRSVCLGSYQPWDVRAQVEIIERELGWAEDRVEGVPPQFGYEKIECAMQGVRDYLKHLKRGYARTSHVTSIDIRNGRMDRDTALALVKKYEGMRPASLDLFLKYLDLSEEQFNELALKHIVSPHDPDVASIPRGEPLADMAEWDTSRIGHGRRR